MIGRKTTVVKLSYSDMKKLNITPLDNFFFLLSYVVAVLIVGHDSIVSDIKYPRWLEFCVRTNDNVIMNVISSIILLCLVGYIVYNIILNFEQSRVKNGSLFRFVFLCLSFWLLIRYRDIELPHIWNNVSYIWYGYLAVVWLIVQEFLRFTHNDKNKKRTYPFDKELSGFSTQTPQDDLKEFGGDLYAAVIVNKLLNTKVDEAYALGISGSWGSGKTQFLKNIMNYLEGRAVVIEYNPWLASSASMIITNFFEQLSSEFGIKTKNQINKYVSQLVESNVGIASYSIIKFVKSFVSENIHISDVRKQISHEISAKEKPFVIIIDDMDRLEKDEILEVLRLIRSTANFKNMYYLVTYDKEYVVSSLNDCKVSNANKYLDKIFNLEIKLPVPSKEYLMDMLIEEFETQAKDLDIFVLTRIRNQMTLSSLDISKYLRNFRDIKRFVNLLCSDLEYVVLSGYSKEIDIMEFFLLELLYYTDSKSYKALSDEPSKFFQIEKDSVSKIVYTYKYTDTQLDKTQNLIKSLFNKKDSYDRLSIQLLSNYDRYFFLHNNPHGISQNEFNIMLHAESKIDVEEKIRTWVESSHITSLEIQTKFINNSQWYILSGSLWKNYIGALFEWCKQITDEDVKNYVLTVWGNVFLNKNLHDRNSDIIIKSINDGIDDLVNCALYVKAQMILISIMSYLTKGGEVVSGNMIPYFVWTKDKPAFVRDKICDVFRSFLRINQPSIYDLCSRDNLLCEMLFYSVGNPPIGAEEARRTMVLGELKEYFSKTRKNNEFKIFSAMLSNTTHKIEPFEVKKDIADYLVSIFGNITYLKEFVYDCFSANEKQNIDVFFDKNPFLRY